MEAQALQDKFKADMLLENRYLLKEFLAAGGFGAVFRATHQLLGKPVRQVAVKITKDQVSAADAESILSDAIILAKVMADEIEDSEASRYLVHIYDLGVLLDHDHHGFIVMELLPGGLDKKRDMYQRMAQETCMRYMRQMCKALGALHLLPKPVIHRDLKPENVLLTKTDEVRITDFGLAARAEERYGYVQGFAGTEHYMAPEVLLRQESSAASDVYSLGIMMYEMLTGLHPFRGLIPPVRYSESGAREWIAGQKRHTAPPSPAAHNNTVDARLEAIIMRCLKFHDYERFPDAAALLEAIEGSERGKPVTRESLLEQGAVFFEASKFAEAAATLRQGAEMRPLAEDETQFRLQYQRALALLAARNWAEAVGVLRAAEDLNEKKNFLISRRERAEFYQRVADLCEKGGNVMMAGRYGTLARKERGG